MGGTDKIWARLGSGPVVAESLERLAPLADETIVVVRNDSLHRARCQLAAVCPGLRVVEGGAERSDSVLNGLLAVHDAQIVAIHDAARPFVTARILLDGVSLLDRWEGAIPVVPIADTLKRIDEDGGIVETVDRSTIRSAQTPQVFRLESLLGAYEKLGGNRGDATDDAAVLERVGVPVATFPGSPLNYKITTPLDLTVARLLSASGAAAR